MQKPTVWKKETKPVCIRGEELTEAYERSDLEFAYVFAKCKKLKQLKDIELSLERIEAFYIEFLHMDWTKKIFDERFEVVKRAKLYGTVFDLSTWLESEITYGEFEFNIKLNKKINDMILEGERLNSEIKLTEAELRLVKLAAVKQLKFDLNNRRYELMEQAKLDLKKQYLETLKGKKKKIAEMSLQEKMKIVDKLYETGKIKGEGKGFEYNVILHNLEDYADLVENI